MNPAVAEKLSVNHSTIQSYYRHISNIDDLSFYYMDIIYITVIF